MADPRTGFGARISIVVVSPAVTATFSEVEITPSGIQGDEKIDTTTNDNTRLKSYIAGDLVESTDASFSADYNLSKKAEILSIINIAGTVTLTDKLGNTEVKNGWLTSAMPEALVAGQSPKMACTISFEGEDSTGTNNDSITIAI